MIVLASRDAAAAGDVAERLRQRIVAGPEAIPVRLTASFGVAAARLAPEADLEEMTEVLLPQADRALYQAKAAGRNRVVVASDHLVAGA